MSAKNIVSHHAGGKRALSDWLRKLIIRMKVPGWAPIWHAQAKPGGAIQTGFGLNEYGAWLSRRLVALGTGTTALLQQLDLAIEADTASQHESPDNSESRVLISALCHQISLNTGQVSHIHEMQHLPSRWHAKSTKLLQKLADILEQSLLSDLIGSKDHAGEQAGDKSACLKAVNALINADVETARTCLLAVLKLSCAQMTDAIRGQICYGLGLVAVLEMNNQDASHYFGRAVQYVPDDVEYLHCAVKFAGLAGDLELAEKYARSGIALTGNNLHADTNRLAGFQFSLAGILDQKEQQDEAVDLYHAALNAQLENSGSDPLAVARSYSAIACNLDKRGRHREAGPVHQKATQIIGVAKSGDTYDLARIFEQMAMCLAAAGQVEDATNMFDKTLEMHQRIYDGDTPELIVCFGSAAFTYKAAGQDVAAGNLYRKALDGSMQLFGSNHPQTARCHDDLAGLLSSVGDHEGAEQHYCLALEIHQKISGSFHITTALGLGRVARCLEMRNEIPAAEALLRRSLLVFEQIGDQGQAGIAGACDALARNLVKQGRVSQASPLMEQALAHATAMHGEEHPETRRLLVYLSEFS
ncbi:MAG: tetratricopeptide repeat protein [Cohaesibacteraceae bacterium]|nr:tetratricopeptide repeat protein [Cohaesibacteraceae bacterium]MBL4875866.1 tetratricopeptide repeat protein [Cohaesibacteraceae bacterium]